MLKPLPALVVDNGRLSSMPRRRQVFDSLCSRAFPEFTHSKIRRFAEIDQPIVAIQALIRLLR